MIERTKCKRGCRICRTRNGRFERVDLPSFCVVRAKGTHVERAFDQRTGLSDVQRGRRVEQQLDRVADDGDGLRLHAPADHFHRVPGHSQTEPRVLADLPRHRERGQHVGRRRVLDVRVQEADVHRGVRSRLHLNAQLHHLQRVQKVVFFF